MPIKLNTASGGGVILTGANTASDKTITVPAVDATMLTDSSGVLNIGSGQVYKDASGNVGIGTSSPQGTSSGRTVLTVNGTSDVSLNVASGGTQRAYLYSDGTFARLSSFGALPLALGTNDTERARIDTSGNLLVGTTSDVIGSSSNSIQAKSSSACHGFYRTSSTAASGIGFFYSDSGATQRTQAYFRVDGGLANYSANNQNLSDERIKKDISLAGSYIRKICSIPVKNFRYKKDEDTSPITLGVIAQDVQAIAPELVCIDGFENEKAEDGSELLSIYQTDLQYALMKCIQEQQQMIETLQAKVAALEAK